MNASAQPARDDAVDDVQSKPGAALAAPRREKRIERPAPDIGAHAAAVIGKLHFDVIIAGFLDLDMHLASLAAGKRMRDRVERTGTRLPPEAILGYRDADRR